MSSLNQQLFVIRRVGTEDYESGYGAYAVPKLYTRGSANSVVGSKNKQGLRFTPVRVWEAIPVQITLLPK